MKLNKLLISLFLAGTSMMFAQMHVEIDGKDVFNLPEAGAVIVEDDTKLYIAAVMPADMRIEDYKSLDLQKDDVVIMVNGGKVTTASQLRSIYKDAKIGEMIKIAVKRDGKPIMVSFKKADPSKLPKMKIVTTDDGGEHEDVLVLPEIGVVVKDQSGKMVIESIFQTPDGEGSKDVLMKGDVLLSINGKKLKNVMQAQEILGKIGKGEMIKVGITRKGKQLEVGVPKLEMKNRIMLSK